MATLNNHNLHSPSFNDNLSNPQSMLRIVINPLGPHRAPIPAAGPSESFTSFTDLPPEIRLRIWHFSAPSRPRVIQISYDHETKQWVSCKDGCGGLPSIVHVSREARAEALRRYTRVFGCYFDLEEDTILISDPFFSIRAPQKVFLDSEITKRLVNLAFDSSTYMSLEGLSKKYPDACKHPVKILRELPALKHFKIALSDGEYSYFTDNDSYHYTSDGEWPVDEDLDEDLYAIGFDEGGQAMEPLENTLLSYIAHDLEQHHALTEPLTEREPVDAEGLENEGDGEDVEAEQSTGPLITLQQTADLHAHWESVFSNDLVLTEAVTLSYVLKGYDRYVGNICFESAMYNPDLWDQWEAFKSTVVRAMRKEKQQFPDWVRPVLSVMEIMPGLSGLGDFWPRVHALGDHTDREVESYDADADEEHEEEEEEEEEDE